MAARRTCWRSASAGSCGCPVGLGLALCWYFALPAEPPVWAGIAALLLLAAALAGRWRFACQSTGRCSSSPAWFAVGAVLSGLHRWRRSARTWSQRPCWSGAAPTSSRRPYCWSRIGAGPAADARAAGDRGLRARGHPGAGQGERAAGRPGGGAGRPDPSAGHAHAAVGAGRAARLRLRPPRLFHAARRGRLRLGSAGAGRPGATPAAGRLPYPPCASRSRTRSPCRSGRRRGRRGGASDRAARRSARAHLGRVGGGRHHPSAVHLRPAHGAGRRHRVLRRADRACAGAAARSAAAGQEAGRPARPDRRVRLPPDLRGERAGRSAPSS